MSSVQFSSQPYLINVGEADKSRAASLNLIFDPHSINFFPFDKINEGDKLLFAGCGNGQLVVEIAKEIIKRGLNVNIVALDIAEQQIACAREYAILENVTGIEWRVLDVHSLGHFKGGFDMVHARFLLNHLTDAALVTELLCDTLNGKGIFIGEEFAGDEVDIFPVSPQYTRAIEEWLKMVKQQHTAQKSNMAFAEHFPLILKNIGMSVTKESQPNPVASNEKQKNVFPESMTNAYKIHPEELHSTIPAAKAALENLRDSNCFVIFKYFTQIEAEKTA